MGNRFQKIADRLAGVSSQRLQPIAKVSKPLGPQRRGDEILERDAALVRAHIVNAAKTREAELAEV